MTNEQLGKEASKDFPGTRYQGSKRKLLEWLWSCVGHIQFDTVLDLFSGSAAVSYLFKTKNKRVVSNDYLRSNAAIARALVVNEGTQLGETEATSLFEKKSGKRYDDFIERTYTGIFFTDSENRWLDVVAQNIADVAPGPKRDLAYFALFQACLAKRPYNLFHRANLYMRLSEVERTFGNKATWDKPFEEHFIANLREANRAVFDNGRRHVALCGDAKDAPSGYDLVYVDPPYLNSKGVGVDYMDFYHFLDGLTEYEAWPRRITQEYKHKPYARRRDGWLHKDTIRDEFEYIIRKHEQSYIVISYRSNGIPSIDGLLALIEACGRCCCRSSERSYRYVLSTSRVKEAVLIVAPLSETAE